MAYVLHGIQCPADELVEHLFTNQANDTTNTHQRVNLAAIFRAAENLDAEICVDKLARELLTICFHNFLFFKFTPYEVLNYLRIFCIFVLWTMQN